jgi:hypothetical protein
MSNLPPLEVIIPTLSTEQHDRRAVLHETVSTLRTNLRYSGKKKFLISADGLDPSGLFIGETDVRVIMGITSLGANTNNLLLHAETDILFQQDDDLYLLEPLSLDRHVEKLVSDPTAGWIRLWGVGYHHIRALLDGEYWRCDTMSSEVYLLSFRPHLKHKRFHDHYGLYPAGFKAGETEEGMGYQMKAVHRDRPGPDVLVPLSGLPYDNIYQHVGVESLRVAGY